MDSKKYIGMDVHKESISIAVMNGAGKIVMECVVETKASMILQFINGLRGDLQVTFEEGTSAAWLYDLLKPHVTKVVVCDPRKNASMKEGNRTKLAGPHYSSTTDLPASDPPKRLHPLSSREFISKIEKAGACNSRRAAASLPVRIGSWYV